MPRILFGVAILVAVFVFSGCQTSHQVELKPVEIKPIHITVDVNVRVQRALDDFFDDIEAEEARLNESEAK